MKITLQRKYRNVHNGNRVYCIGKLSVDGKYVCDTIEDEDYGWVSGKTSVKDIQKIKALHKSKTAIPSGEYKITLDVVSPKYFNSAYYRKAANGSRVPRLLDVPGFDGVLIHTGNTEQDSAGCLIVGWNKIVGKVIDSKKAFETLYPILLNARNRGETIWIKIE